LYHFLWGYVEILKENVYICRMINELIEKARYYNVEYRKGEPKISDKGYDELIEEIEKLDPNHSFLKEVGHSDDSERMAKLPIDMASMNKLKNIEELRHWMKMKDISPEEVVVLTSKYDGLSLVADEVDTFAWTRGDGIHGQRSKQHYMLMSNLTTGTNHFTHTYGEAIMLNSDFDNKYANDFANPRNLVGGLLNGTETPNNDKLSILPDVQYIKYGGIPNGTKKYNTKSEILDDLNAGQSIPVPYELIKLKDLTHDILVDHFNKWSEQFAIDGIIIELNSLDLQDELGRETSSNNPVWARAYKSPVFEQSAETTIIGITWGISKQGLLKPVLHIDPVHLDGVTVSNVTGNNARYILKTGLGVGARVVVKRSGMVIPKIHDVLETVEFVMPNIPDIEWNENGVELRTIYETDEQRFKQAVSYFEILEVDAVREGVVKQLWDAGFNSIPSILNMTLSDYQNLPGFGDRKSQKVFENIQKSTKDVSLSKLQHATGFFHGLGSKKLVQLEHFTEKPTIEQVVVIEGFAETSARVYVENYDRFFDYMKQLPVTVTVTEEVVAESNDLEGKQFVFTGVRLPEYEKKIINYGGLVGGSVSKKTTHLVMKSMGSGSSKERKAIGLGAKILEVKDLEEIIYTIENK
jgi:DNA ligase (NAD+)